MDNIDKIKGLAEKYELKLLLQFGSSVTGKMHKESDVDVAYLSSRELSLREEASFVIELMPILKNKFIDIVNIHKAPPLLLYAISRQGKILYQATPTKFHEFRAYAFKRYIEAKPLFELMEERLLAAKS